VILHVRRSQDQILKQLRLFKLSGGIAHAFNGSMQQAQHFIDLGFKLGFGGAMTYTRALQIRSLAQQLPLKSIVLETDAPDIAPSWLFQNGALEENTESTQHPVGQLTDLNASTEADHTYRQFNNFNQFNSPQQIPRIAQVLAQLRNVSIEQIAQQTCANVFSVLPRMQLSGKSIQSNCLQSKQKCLKK